MKKHGRPTTYNQEIARLICEQISTTDQGLRQICKRKGFPDRATVYRWLATNEDFCDQYARAREFQAQIISDELVEIADSRQKHGIDNRLRVDTRKWILARLAPKKYADVNKMEHSGPGGKPVQIQVRSLNDFYADVKNGGTLTCS